MNALDRLASDRMTFGVELPLDNDWSPAGQSATAFSGRAFGVPDVEPMIDRVVLAEKLGFDAVWMRDVPVHDPEFGDAGQLYDPFPLLGYLAAKTNNLVLGTAAVVAPLRDPIQLAKMAASVHKLSNERFIFGIASGDRPVEYPLMGLPFETRGETLRNSLATMRHLWKGGTLDGPRAPVTVQPFVGDGPPIVVAGMGQQSLGWLAQNIDGWFTYPGPPQQTQRRLDMWRKARSDAGHPPAPVLTAMMLDLAENPAEPLQPIRIGARTGRNALREYIDGLHEAGVSHLSINLRQSRRPVEDVLAELSTEIIHNTALETQHA